MTDICQKGEALILTEVKNFTVGLWVDILI